MRPIRELIKDPRAILLGLMSRTAALWPDKLYLKIVYRLYMGKPLNLRKPRTYTEKLNWLKVNLKDENYTKLVDKYEVKKYVAEKLGGNEHIIKILEFGSHLTISTLTNCQISLFLKRQMAEEIRPSLFAGTKQAWIEPNVGKTEISIRQEISSVKRISLL